MFNSFKESSIGFQTFNRHTGQASLTVIPPEAFADARDEIVTWDNHKPTPLYSLAHLAKSLGLKEILYKDEGPRFGLGSFKALGGAYAAASILKREVEKKSGRTIKLSDLKSGQYAADLNNITLVSATDGNHGRSLAWGAQMFGAKCKIYIHAEVSPARAAAMENLGADVTRIDGDYDDSVLQAKAAAEENGWFVVSDTSWPGYTQPPTDVMAGYGVMTSEICDQVKTPPSHLFIQGGVGGLAASVAAALRQNWGSNSPRVCVVEPALAACLFKSAQHDKLTAVQITQETIMAGLSCGEPSPLAWEILREEASSFITISDSLIPETMRYLAKPQGSDPIIEAGESAVAGLAALIAVTQKPELKTSLGLDENSSILVIGSEGATDEELYKKIISGEI